MESSSNIKEAFFLNLFKGNVKEEPHPTPPVFVTLYNNGLGNRAHSSVYKEYKFFNQIKEYYKRKAEPLLPALGWGKGYGGRGAPASVLGGELCRALRGSPWALSHGRARGWLENPFGQEKPALQNGCGGGTGPALNRGIELGRGMRIPRLPWWCSEGEVSACAALRSLLELSAGG